MENMYLELSSLMLYREILDLPVMTPILTLAEALNTRESKQITLLSAYAELYYRLAGTDCGAYLLSHMRTSDCPYATAAARGEGDLLLTAAKWDISILNRLLGVFLPGLKEAVTERCHGQPELPEIAAGDPIDLEALTGFYQRDGFGVFASARAFVWEGDMLVGLENPDPLSAADMIGYEWQRQEVYKNTQVLIEGGRAANVLLHGDSGTGKSATVKALIHEPAFQNLRIIEVTREGLGGLRKLLSMLPDMSQKFILFIDDLSFSGEEAGFSALKSVLEGGLGTRPMNVAVYATSNRRHMIRETFGERAGDDIHVSETIQEKSSLSDRFGLRIPYLSLNKNEYLAMIGYLAAERGIEAEPSDLREHANKWEIAHGGRTPRVARQFIDYYDAKRSRGKE